jgi:hypothetical protein
MLTSKMYIGKYKSNLEAKCKHISDRERAAMTAEGNPSSINRWNI